MSVAPMRERATVALVQWLPVPGRPEENLRRALDLVAQLGEKGCDLIVLPELWPSGFNWDTLKDDLAESAEPLNGARTDALAEAARRTGSWLAAGSVPELDGDRIFNTALLFSRDGELQAWHRKAHLYAPLGEDDALAAGDTITTVETDELGIVGLSVCFDGDFPETARAMANRGARVVVEPCAYEVAAESWWDRLYPANALVNGQWWFMANQCGSNPSGTLLGASRIISPAGEVVAEGRRARNGESPKEDVVIATVDLRSELERVDRDHSALWELRRPELYGDRAHDTASR